MNVEQLMTKNVATVGPEDTLERAAQLMWEQDCGCVPVVDDDHHILGMITDRDTCMAAYTRGGRLQDIRVGECMSRIVHAARPIESHSAVLERMRSAQVRRIPVVDTQDRLLGIVSINDLSLAAAAGAIHRDAVFHAFAGICHHRGLTPTQFAAAE